VGSDDLFHKRKAKSARDSARRQPVRASYDKVLIVCEGAKTEPLYFKELVDHYEIHSANVTISGDCGSDPVSVVKHGIQLYDKEKLAGSGPFDKVYCVFDRDAHPNYLQAQVDLSNIRKKGVFYAIKSIPCFEYWLLLHFIYKTAPFMAVGNVSSGAAALRELKKYWPDYEKAGVGSFSYTLSKLEYAKANAKRALREAERNHTDNPSTNIHELVDYLQNIKNGR